MSDSDRILSETTSIYLRELAAAVKKGKLGVPPFQRDFVWSRKQIIDLFDSISKGYPIGAFLLWTRDENWEGTKDILTGEEDPDAKPTWYILDGCQRLTSFYGCTLNGNKPADFRLNYDLDTATFGYAKDKEHPVLPVSDIYDTFTLLDRLDAIRSHYPEDKARIYISRAKELNSILQEYAVSRIVISQCSLDQATTVFSRLNSQGTVISKPYMVQAMSYKAFGQRTLVETLESMASSLVRYGYGNIPTEDLLNCFFRFYNKPFFDISLKEIEKIQPLKYEKEVRECVERAVRFLRDECLVESWDLLPYRNQFQSLIWWFKDHPVTSSIEKAELRKWFYYTTLNFTFQNGSIGYIRNTFSRFETFVEGKASTPIDYQKELPEISLDFGFTHNSSRSKLLMIALSNHYREFDNVSSQAAGWQKYLRIGEQRKPTSYYPVMRDEDTSVLTQILLGEEPYDTGILEKFALDRETVEAFRMGFDRRFEQLREQKLINIEKVFVSRFI